MQQRGDASDREKQRAMPALADRLVVLRRPRGWLIGDVCSFQILARTGEWVDVEPGVDVWFPTEAEAQDAARRALGAA
jgi:hypothetical protein